MQIEELERLHEAATPGPWELGGRYDNNGGDKNACFQDVNAENWGALARFVVQMEDSKEDEPHGVANATLIVALRNALPDIIAMARERDSYKAALGDAVSVATENARQRDLMKYHLSKVLHALGTFLAEYEDISEAMLVDWLGEGLGRNIIAAQMAASDARTALERRGSE